MKDNSFGIHWFRRDLRVAGNPALGWNWKNHDGHVVGLFCFDSKFLAREDFSHNRFAFFMNAIVELKKELQMIGSDLLIIDELPQKAFPKIIKHFKGQKLSLESISWNRDYEPFAKKRDEEVQDIIEKNDVETHTERDHLIIEPHELWKDEKKQETYQIYSPFGRKWFDQIHQDKFRERIEKQSKAWAHVKKLKSGKLEKDLFKLTWKKLWEKDSLYEDSLKDFQKENDKHVTIPIPPAGILEADKALEAFTPKLDDYKEKRDFPDLEATSDMSMYLKNGTITISMIIQKLELLPNSFKGKDGRTHYLKELVWREFYYHILSHKPEVENEAFLEKYSDLGWNKDKKWFQAWKDGMTGFPIVDAGMRQLKTTGKMHNRVRMIVASFLTKDLLINWQWGERYFMEQLLDGDLASNNGGWQWAASTGCDAQPYFRIFNPWSQSVKFDPDAKYIKKFIPELKDLEPKIIHNLYKHPDACPGYPQPIVDHSEQREKALAMYKVQ
jgi:deoxyribodipyrimidine photo-lyase